MVDSTGCVHASTHTHTHVHPFTSIHIPTVHSTAVEDSVGMLVVTVNLIVDEPTAEQKCAFEELMN